MIHLVLRNACLARLDEAIYFSIMLRVLDSRGLDREVIMSNFKGLFVRQRLVYCRDAIITRDFLLGLEPLELRLMPPGLAYRFTCPSEGVCVVSNKIHNISSPSPGADDDYDMTNICLWCRLDVELTWILGHFRFFDLGFLL